MDSISDFAIFKFKESLESQENDQNLIENYNFTHWKEIFQKIQSVWLKSYSDKLKIYNDERDLDSLFLKFRSDITKIVSKRSEYQTLKKYFDYVIEYKVNEIREESLNLNLEQKENLQSSNNLGNQNQTKYSNSQLMKKEILKKISQFEIDNLIRAHSKDSNINDSSSLVTDCAFEILNTHSRFGDLNQIFDCTNICATCGNNIINIIDVDSGKILKRFNDDMYINKTKESFNTIAWSILNNSTSVLVGAGTHGQLKVIVPKYSSCLTRIDAHSGPISCLLFHYKFANILLTGSNDNTIKIWRLSLKEAESVLDAECSYELLTTIDYNKSNSKKKESVLSMCFIKNDYLLISTNENIYSVDLRDEVLFNSLRLNDDSMNIQQQDSVSYMTSNPFKKGNFIWAEPVRMIGVSANNVLYDEFIISNKILYFNNLLFANLINSNLVYIIEIIYEEKIVLKVVSNIKVGEEKATENTKMSIFKENSNAYILKSSTDGSFYCLCLDESLKTYSAILRYSIPTDYTIKPYSEPGKKTNIKNYGLLEKPTVIKAVCNGGSIVSITNQNMILTWKKLRVLNEDRESNHL